MRELSVRYIINPVSGRGLGRKYENRIREMYGGNGEGFVFLTENSQSAFDCGKRAVEEGIKRICFAGGDGTGNWMVNGMIAGARSLAELPDVGILPCGTGNNFAKNVGVPKNLETALCAFELGQHSVPVDIGRIKWSGGERYFLNVASFGFDAGVVEISPEYKKKCKSFPALGYLFAAIQKIRQGFDVYEVELTGNGISRKEKMVQIAVVNGETYGGFFKIAPGANVADGKMNICIIGNMGKAKALLTVFLAIFGMHVKMPGVQMSSVTSLKIVSPKPLPCEIDGEFVGFMTECEISVIEHGIKVVK
ncbi:MAG: diacylglycerol kinase family protein [Patescibacteria group bacterium]